MFYLCHFCEAEGMHDQFNKTEQTVIQTLYFTSLPTELLSLSTTVAKVMTNEDIVDGSYVAVTMEAIQ